mmetsp:Transcript_38942/g.63657  ORF Transcript_38942/g.63657 Transcript_38942/m.63657 type:complete len:219 (+) Transcript_38942:794-1450(+)
MQDDGEYIVRKSERFSLDAGTFFTALVHRYTMRVGVRVCLRLQRRHQIRRRMIHIEIVAVEMLVEVLVQRVEQFGDFRHDSLSVVLLVSILVLRAFLHLTLSILQVDFVRQLIDLHQHQRDWMNIGRVQHVIVAIVIGRHHYRLNDAGVLSKLRHARHHLIVADMLQTMIQAYAVAESGLHVQQLGGLDGGIKVEDAILGQHADRLQTTLAFDHHRSD